MTCDVEDEGQLREIYELLSAHYVEDDDNMFRFAYSREFLKWALQVGAGRWALHFGLFECVGWLQVCCGYSHEPPKWAPQVGWLLRQRCGSWLCCRWAAGVAGVAGLLRLLRLLRLLPHGSCYRRATLSQHKACCEPLPTAAAPIARSRPASKRCGTAACACHQQVSGNPGCRCGCAAVDGSCCLQPPLAKAPQAPPPLPLGPPSHSAAPRPPSRAGKLVAFISGIPATVRVNAASLRTVEINFLCVHK